MGFNNHFNCSGHDSLGFDGMFDPLLSNLNTSFNYMYFQIHSNYTDCCRFYAFSTVVLEIQFSMLNTP
jgi:hypothetical protein